VQEYERLHEIGSNSEQRKTVNPGYGPLGLVLTTIFAMAAGALVGSRMTKKL